MLIIHLNIVIEKVQNKNVSFEDTPKSIQIKKHISRKPFVPDAKIAEEPDHYEQDVNIIF